MRHQPAFRWATTILVASLFAGCGGDSDDASDQAATEIVPGVTLGGSSIISGGNIRIISGGGNAKKAIAPEDFQNHDMEGFHALGNYSYANASLKLLISALGPKNLLDHLESFKNSAPNPDERTAAAEFADIIRQAYQSERDVETADFIERLQNLAPFNRRNAAGDWEFPLKRGAVAQEPEPGPFLVLLAELFRLNTLPGWTFEVHETWIRGGEERPHKDAKSAFALFQPIDLARINPADLPTLRMQNIVDLLHAPADAQV